MDSRPSLSKRPQPSQSQLDIGDHPRSPVPGLDRSRLTPPDIGTQASARLSFCTGIDEGVGEESEHLLTRAVLAGRTLFRAPVRPVSELMADAGLSIEGAFVAPTNSEWKPPGMAAAEDHRSRLRQVYRFNACCDDAFDLVLDAWTARLAGRDLPARDEPGSGPRTRDRGLQ